MKKIKFVANYDSDINIYNSIINCFPMSDEEKQLITYKNDYEYLAIFNGYKKEIFSSRDKTIGFLQEPIGNINYDRNLHMYCSKIFCQSKEMFRPNNGIVETNLSMFFSNHVNYNYLNFLEPKIKLKKICIFLSGIQFPNNPNWKNNNYSKRINLLKKILNSSLDIDIYGRNLNINDTRYKGSPENKHEVLKNYKYSIAIENCCEKNYVSEKFFDCILNDTVPLYYGCPNIDDIFNNNCYEKIDIEDSNIIKIIEDIVSKNFINYKEALQDARKKYFNNFNPIKKMVII
jgi:hypothetical protein